MLDFGEESDRGEHRYGRCGIRHVTVAIGEQFCWEAKGYDIQLIIDEVLDLTVE